MGVVHWEDGCKRMVNFSFYSCFGYVIANDAQVCYDLLDYILVCLV